MTEIPLHDANQAMTKPRNADTKTENATANPFLPPCAAPVGVALGVLVADCCSALVVLLLVAPAPAAPPLNVTVDRKLDLVADIPICGVDADVTAAPPEVTDAALLDVADGAVVPVVVASELALFAPGTMPVYVALKDD